MALFPHLSFTRLVRDFSQDGLRSYAETLASGIAAWEDAAVAAERFLAGGPLSRWICPPPSVPADERRIVSWRVRKASEQVWDFDLHPGDLPYISGALFLYDEQDRSSDWRGYGDHLIHNAIADTAGNIDDMDHVRGFPSSIYLNKKLLSVATDLAPNALSSGGSALTHLASKVEETLNCSSLGQEIFMLRDKRRVVRKFLTRCDTVLLERWGPSKASELLAPLGVTWERWRKAS